MRKRIIALCTVVGFFTLGAIAVDNASSPELPQAEIGYAVYEITDSELGVRPPVD